MTRNIIGCIVLFASVSTYGMHVLQQKVSLPSEDILKNRIDGLALPPKFDDYTKLSHNITNYAEEVGDVLACVTAALVIYNGLIEKSSVAPDQKVRIMTFLNNQKMVIVNTILQDQAAILAQIEEAQTQLSILYKWAKLGYSRNHNQ